MGTHPDAMNSGLEVDILKIPKDISEMWVWVTDTQEVQLPSSYLMTDFVRVLCRTGTYPDSAQPRLISMRSCKKLKSVTGGKSLAQWVGVRIPSFVPEFQNLLALH